MKLRTLSDLRALLASPPFVSWWDALSRLRARRDELWARADELSLQAQLMDFRAELAQKEAIAALDRASEGEDAAARMIAEGQERENDSFRAVAEFEEQRFRATEAWYRVCAAEKRQEELQAKVQQERTAASAKGEAPKSEAELRAADAAVKEAQAAYAREEERKAQQWARVEELFSRGTELSLLTAEAHASAKKIRRDAERLFQEAEERKGRARKLREDAAAARTEAATADGEVQALLAQARTAFDCACGESFLYFPESGDGKRALAVSLRDDPATHNLEVRALGIYSVDRQRGVSFLEPALERSAPAGDADRRFDAYFLQGRAGAEERPQDAATETTRKSG
ncbi:MAG: hypothetical protein ACK4N5_08360 [Myxococcales bacterium]